MYAEYICLTFKGTIAIYEKGDILYLINHRAHQSPLKYLESEGMKRCGTIQPLL